MEIGRALAAAVLGVCGLLPLQGAGLTLGPDGITVYDSVNNVSWLADVNLPASNRFGLPVCSGSAIDTKTCVNPSGSMSYQAAAAWVKAMNAANYLGHNNWQIPTTPQVDNSCGFIGPQNNSFGFNCSGSALGFLYYTALGLKTPNTAVPIPNQAAGPFNNFQPYLYWTQTSGPEPTGNSGCCATFSFASGWQGSNITSNYLYVLPMMPGKIAGTPASTGNGLQVSSDGKTVYDPVANVTWLANANIAATNAFSLPPCTKQGAPNLCVNADGAMNWTSASQFVANMNAAGYLGQTQWELPSADLNCSSSYICADQGAGAPFQELYYGQLGFSPGTPVVATPNVAVGPFKNIQPYLYWACQGTTFLDACQPGGAAPGFEWSFSFGNGFEGTDVLANDLYVTAYFAGPSTSTSGPEITLVANAEGESPIIAPNTWIEIKGVNLAPAGDTRVWLDSDFAGNQMPTKLDGVSVKVNGKNAYVYYVSPPQINVLTPPDAMSGSVQVVVNNNGTQTAAFSVQAQPTSPSFFAVAPYVLGQHADYSLLAPYGSPAKPSETILLYGNGFGATSVPVVSGSITQGGSLTPLPVVKIGGVNAMVAVAGLIVPGEYVFAVTVPASVPDGDQPITATYGGSSTQPGVLITIQH